MISAVCGKNVISAVCGKNVISAERGNSVISVGKQVTSVNGWKTCDQRKRDSY